MNKTARTAAIGTVAVAGTVVAIATTLTLSTQGAPRLDSQSAEAYNATVFTESVEYYQQVCPQVERIASVADNVSISLEESVGAPNASEIRINGLQHSAAELRDAANILANINAPTEVFNASGTASYEGATQPLADASFQWADGLGEVEGLLQSGDTEQADRRQPQVMADGSLSVSNSLSNLLASAPISNAKTRDEIAQQPGCAILFKDSPTPAPTQVIHPAADFHARLGKAATLVTDGTKPLRELPEMEEKPLMEAVGILRDGWLARAEAAGQAVAVLNGWEPPKDPDPITEAAIEGYDEAHRDALSIYIAIEQQARGAVDFLNSVNEDTDPQQIDEFLVRASEAASNESIQEAKLHIRIARVVPLPNTVTSQAVDDIQL